MLVFLHFIVLLFETVYTLGYIRSTTGLKVLCGVCFFAFLRVSPVLFVSHAHVLPTLHVYLVKSGNMIHRFANVFMLFYITFVCSKALINDALDQ